MSALLNRDILIRNMTFIYRTMMASAPLLEFAIKRSEGSLRDYYKLHLAEERGHDLLLKGDLGALGVTDIPHDFTAAMIAGAQYYLIAHFHPALLLGYMMVLESKPMTEAEIEAIERAHSTTQYALRLHSQHDPQHFRDLQTMRASLPQELQAAVDWNAAGVRDTLNAEFARWTNG